MTATSRLASMLQPARVCLAGIGARAKRFKRNSSGAIALQFGIMLVPLVSLSAGVVDVVNIMRMNDILQHAADASSVGSVAVNSPATVAAASMTGNGTIIAGQTDATNIFNADVINSSSFATLTYTPAVQKTGLMISSSVSYTATVNTTFLPIIGISTWTIQGHSYASANLAPYVDFYLLLDNTPSMGIAATQAGITQMVALTVNSPNNNAQLNAYITANNNANAQCAFACHDMSVAPNDFYNLAKTNNIEKRIDVVREATQSLTTTAQTESEVASEFRMAIYTFGSTADTIGLTQVAPLSSNLTTVSQQASAIDVMSVPANNYHNDEMTDFDGVLTSINTAISAPGDGSSPNTPQKILFFVTDGVADAYYPSTCSESSPGGGRCQEPITVADCTAIKNRGIKIAVLYTTYYPLPTNNWYNTTVASWASQIPTNMQACASSGLYFEVSPTQGISDAMTALFLQAIRTVRMTQ